LIRRLVAAAGWLKGEWVTPAHVCLLAQMSLLNCFCAALSASERVITYEELLGWGAAGRRRRDAHPVSPT